ncbi:16S rRNA (cytidine(1402)-2'-O)-methyltransferase [Mycoplasma sp. 'Moose RK']|uniref:16S rRNA (cytidine(1402)-2'-O)-methyltransferase n=1 Tax=Mycoplasma sp. 'Moose RK' TaxID=2780095 RepID=UPI0018C1F5B6|nr:16S rRNA (cytidine(1402)-2'-O)-methyltransferase [Mycoplasma sp. 'Moose RK']MBG0730984.1 16S rRNA (cytidine(1402)-2'-O)-methyltransferase [Mycoplasma sp. 'Moose RK']
MPKITIISTPIGNLKDISLRAIEILRSTNLIFCEDTRVSKKLLNYLQIYDKKLISYHKFNEKSSINKISAFLDEGKEIVLISDAGAPSISDPGQFLVSWAHEKGIEVDFIPGPSAFVSAFVLSGFDFPLVFMGFFDSRKQQIIKQISNFEEYFSYIFYVSPYKLVQILKIIQEKYDENIEIFLVKEMTKIYQKYYLGTPNQILEQLQNIPKGEFTMVLRLKNSRNERKKQNKYQKFSKIL